MRIVIPSMVTMTLLMIVWTHFTNKGIEKIKPQMEKHLQDAENRQSQMKEMIKENLQQMGIDRAIIENLTDGSYNDRQMQVMTTRMPTKPKGNWAGICRGEDTKIAIARFENDRYWLLIKDSFAGDIAEKGKYDFQITDLYFMPDEGKSYFAEYEQISPRSIKLYRGQLIYALEKSDEIELDF